jgi:hypothetical protein
MTTPHLFLFCFSFLGNAFQYPTAWQSAAYARLGIGMLAQERRPKHRPYEESLLDGYAKYDIPVRIMDGINNN